MAREDGARASSPQMTTLGRKLHALDGDWVLLGVGAPSET
jgi:hypothetical protein